VPRPNFVWFLTKEVLAREWCCTEIRKALLAPNNRDPRIADGLYGGTRRRDSPRRRHIGAATGRTAATSVPGLCFEWPPSHLSAIRVTRALRSNIHNKDASSTYIAAITVLRCDWDERPTVLIGLSVRAVRALRHLFVTFCSSPRMNVRPWDEFTNGTRAANLAYVYLAFDLPRSTYPAFYQDAMSCRVRASAVGKQSAPLAAPAGKVPK
jgi:hypothetical protein